MIDVDYAGSPAHRRLRKKRGRHRGAASWAALPGLGAARWNVTPRARFWARHGGRVARTAGPTLYRASLAGTGGTVDDASRKAFLAECGPFVSFADVFGYIEQKQLLEMMFYAFHRHGATHHIIDSLMKVAGP